MTKQTAWSSAWNAHRTAYGAETSLWRVVLTLLVGDTLERRSFQRPGGV
jgi:hypothetical protein